jgi:hypothetical protein
LVCISRWTPGTSALVSLLTLLTPLYIPGCHPQHGARSVGINKCKCSSKINMKFASAQIIPM